MGLGVYFDGQLPKELHAASGETYAHTAQLSLAEIFLYDNPIKQID